MKCTDISLCHFFAAFFSLGWLRASAARVEHSPCISSLLNSGIATGYVVKNLFCLNVEIGAHGTSSM
jgi:hypothetical protein